MDAILTNLVQSPPGLSAGRMESDISVNLGFPVEKPHPSGTAPCRSHLPGDHSVLWRRSGSSLTFVRKDPH